jgi:hypothetical protein
MKARMKDRIQTITAVAVAVLALATLMYGAWQTKLQTDLRQGELNARLNDRMLEVDRFFVEHARLRPYFYAGKPLPTRGPRRGQVLSAAEMLIDFAAVLASYQDRNMLTDEDLQKWRSNLSTYFSDSPAMQHSWRKYAGEMYDLTTACMLGAPWPPRSAVVALRQCSARAPSGSRSNFEAVVR